MGEVILWTGAEPSSIKKILEPIKTSLPGGVFPSVVPVSGHLVPPMDGNVVVAMGNKALDVLKEHKLVQKGRTISYMRETSIVRPDGWYMISNDPFMVGIDPAIEQLIQWDIQLAARLLVKGTLKPDIGKYAWTTTLHPLREYIELRYAQTGSPVPVALDLETMGLFPYYADKGIVTVQVSPEEGHADVVYVKDLTPGQLTELILDLNWLLNSPMVRLRGANLKFDLVWLYVKWKLECSNFKMDTTIVGSLLNENRSNSLNMHTKLLTSMGGYDDEFNNKYDKGKMELIPKDDLLTYAGGDTDACLRVSNVMVQQLSHEPTLARFYTTILHPAARAFEKIEARGVCVDRGKLEKLGLELDGEIARLEAAAIELMPRRLRIKHLNNLELSKPSLLKDFFFTPLGLNLSPLVRTEKTQEPSTAKDHLLMFADNPEAKAFVDLFEAWSSAKKTKSTYVEGFLKHLRPDGKLHPSYMLFNGMLDDDREGGTNTGRLSAKDPAMQCMVGETLVTTNKGPLRLDTLVAIGGGGLTVLTHTGNWRKIIGTYLNGVQPVFEIKTRTGKSIICTNNHPVLTTRGFIRTDKLELGMEVYVASIHRLSREEVRDTSGAVEGPRDLSGAVELPLRLRGDEGLQRGQPEGGKHANLRGGGAPGYSSRPRAQSKRRSDQHLPVLVEHGEPLHQSEQCCVGPLRGPGHQASRALEEVRELPGGHGDSPGSENVYRAEGRGRELRALELHLAPKEYAGAEHPKDGSGNVAGRDPLRGCLGEEIGYTPEPTVQAASGRVVRGRSNHEAFEAGSAGFVEDEIVSITPCGERETFDLTIDQCHSFVANDVVVHNTLPKHTKWAYKLRLCYGAPPGMVMWEIDFDQGELKITADVSCDTNMLEAYLSGQDLHIKTGGALAGYEYDEMLALKAFGDTDSSSAEYKLFKSIRQKAKAANFGLIYRISVAGYMVFARTTYGVILTQEEAEKHFEQFFGLYDQLHPWHDEYVNHARKYKWVASPLGRIRHLPLITSKDSKARGTAERQAINAPIQGCLSDMGLYAIALLSEQYPDLWIAGMTHDALYGYCREEEVGLWCSRIAGTMSNLPLHLLGWEPKLQFTASAEAGKSWAEMHGVAV